jgi:hypothetical protein
MAPSRKPLVCNQMFQWGFSRSHGHGGRLSLLLLMCFADWGVPRVIRSHILQRILTHALQRHCQIPADGVQDPSVLVQALLELPSATKAALSGKTVGVDAFTAQQAVQAAFEKLSATLRSLTGLPMAIATVVGTAPGEIGTPVRVGRGSGVSRDCFLRVAGDCDVPVAASSAGRGRPVLRRRVPLPHCAAS